MEIDWKAVARRLDAELLDRNLSTQALADRAGVDRKTVDRLRHGRQVRAQTLAWIEEALGAPLRSAAADLDPDLADASFGGYTRRNFGSYEGHYYGFRRSFDRPGHVICFHMIIYWDAANRRLGFEERQNNATPDGSREYVFRGALGIPPGIGVLHFICMGGGAARLATTSLMRASAENYMRGFLLAVNEVADLGYYPATTPVYFIKLEAEPSEEELADRVGVFDKDAIWKPEAFAELEITERKFAHGSALSQ